MKKSRKIQLRRETVRLLTELSFVNGGVPGTGHTCANEVTCESVYNCQTIWNPVCVTTSCTVSCTFSY